MRPRASIRRTMIAIAGVAAALALGRSWSGESLPLGEWTPMFCVAAPVLAVGLRASGRRRRFLVGFAATGLIVNLVFWASPFEWRGEVFSRVVVPADTWLIRASSPPFGQAGLVWFLGTTDRWFGWNPTRYPFVLWFPQIELTVLQLPIAVLGGCLAAIPGRRASTTPETP